MAIYSTMDHRQLASITVLVQRVWALKRDQKVKLHSRAKTIEVELEGLEKLFALKSRLVIPRDSITKITWESDWILSKGAFWWRLGGSYMPGILMAGRYYNRGTWLFAYVRRPYGLASIRAKKVLVIKTNIRYSIIALSCDEATARALTKS